MISSLKGEILTIGNNFVDIEVQDVGYLVWCGLNFLKKRTVGEKIKIYTYQSVSENDVSLFGFETINEVNLFKMLISVSGVGPKSGAQIMGQVDSEEIIKAIGNADVGFFEKIKGIGKKTAQRIIIDLKSKIGGLGELDLTKDDEKTENDLTLSLKQLGFERKEIEKVVAKLPTELITIEEKLEWCLSKI
ncbi:MAG: Holliday junction branch migration protein RuvA [Candidatus Shapirobacteria bacterium]|jgi:Holliday junction DNA helicase RuvA|nr:Holliday junction branch migration protein RuvA [Candidatus Shapirobacteria bacterium]